MRFRQLCLGLSLWGVVCPVEVRGQSEVGGEFEPPGFVFVTGRVVDQSNGRALGSVRVALVEPGPDGETVWAGFTRSNGQFEAPDIPEGIYRLRVSMLSFRELAYTADLTGGRSRDFQIALVPQALDLDPIVAVARRRTRLEQSGFYERREAGNGVTFVREEIEAINPNRVSDLLYGTAGIRVVPSRRFGPAEIRLRNNCVPQVVIDGAPFSMPVALDEVVQVEDLEALEVYTGMSTPMRYSTSTCGTIMAWTRELQPGEGRPLTLARVLGAAGLVSLVLLVAR